MLKPIFLIVLAIYTSNIVIAQSQDNFYLQCLERHLEKHHNQEGGQLYIKSVMGITDAMPEEIKGFKITYLNTEQLKAKTKKEGFVIIQIFPITNQENILNLDINEYLTYRNKKRTYLSMHKSSNFKIGCADGKLTIIDEYFTGS